MFIQSAQEWLFKVWFFSEMYCLLSSMKCRAVFQHLTGFEIWILVGKSYISFHFLWNAKKPCVYVCLCVFFKIYSQLWNYNVIALKRSRVPLMGMNYNGKYQERLWALFGKQLCFYLGLSFANGPIRVSLNQSLLDSKFTFTNVLTSQRSVESSTWVEPWPPWERRSFLLSSF